MFIESLAGASMHSIYQGQLSSCLLEIKQNNISGFVDNNDYGSYIYIYYE